MSRSLKSPSQYPQQGVAVTCRSYREYAAMFALDEDALSRGPVLDVAGGASSFAAEAAARGAVARAADPRYALTAKALYAESAAEIETSSAKLEKLRDVFDWTFYGSPEAHRAGREASLERFIAHYRENASHGVYVPASLPSLPFPDGTFALALCSHFLFLYEEQFTVEFHAAALGELYRVLAPGGELRVYPLSSLRFARYGGLDELAASLGSLGAVVDELPSRLPFLPGSTHLLRVVKPN
ncbi:class I SAM-dependent methyltransferase [Paenibacillus sp. TRM 82003]|nr:class I SAM-dependent methyltransferase [Paenibacillus sp. TRM 82003]